MSNQWEDEYDQGYEAGKRKTKKKLIAEFQDRLKYYRVLLAKDTTHRNKIDRIIENDIEKWEQRLKE